MFPYAQPAAMWVESWPDRFERKETLCRSRFVTPKTLFTNEGSELKIRELPARKKRMRHISIYCAECLLGRYFHSDIAQYMYPARHRTIVFRWTDRPTPEAAL
jgi:hypothetical protein